MDKVIIGFIGMPKSGRTTAAKILQKEGFYFASINDKVSEFASHLFSKSEMQRDGNEILNQVRRRGCSVSKEYWLNLILIEVPDDAQYIIFDDISLDEVDNDKVKAYQICRPEISSERLDGIEIIENDGSLKDFEIKIKEICQKITSS